MDNHTGNYTGNHTVHTNEGGFLTGRNPFLFIPAAPLPTFIIQLLIIVVASRIIKLILSPIKQPAVIAEIISGIILGPTAMGHVPYFTTTIFPPASLPFLNLMSNFGLVLFLFLVGLELDPKMLRKSVKNAFTISIAGMALPFLLGCGTSFILYEFIEPPSTRDKGFLSYLIFLGVAMAITAFPVLARILTELNLLKTKVGRITISAAAVDDATSWCLLALVISLINANSNLTALYVFLMGLGYSIFLIVIVRPIFIWGLRLAGTFDKETPSQASIFAALMIVFISAFITDAIGIHAIFGGFIAGIIMPHENGFAYHITHKLEDIVQILFLPLYFTLSGLKTKIGALDDPVSWGCVVLVIIAACSGKIIGCTLAARVTKLNWRESWTVGFLMNCKGLVELIVLNLGYDSGVISDKTFAIMVIMALITTFITVPVVNFIYPVKYQESEDSKEFKKKEPSLLVSVNRIEQVAPLLNVINLLLAKLNNDKYRSCHGSRKCSESSLSNELVAFKPKASSGSITSLIHIPSSIVTLFPGGKHGDKSDGMVINVLRLIELTARDSSVMLSSNESALSHDPITKLIKTFCEVSNKRNHVNGIVKVVTMELFGKELAKTAEEVNAYFILVPWTGPVGTEDAKGLRRRQSIHSLAQHIAFFQDLLEAKRNVLIFVDRGLGQEVINGEKINLGLGKTREVFLPFFGGRDDRMALSIVMGLGDLQGVKVTVIRYMGGEQDEAVTRFSPRSEGGDGKDEDEKLLSYCFKGRGMEDHGHVDYKEVECNNPSEKALEHLREMQGADLVLIGRESGHNVGEVFDVERRKILGDFAEMAIQRQAGSAGLLVVNSRDRLAHV